MEYKGFVLSVIDEKSAGHLMKALYGSAEENRREGLKEIYG